MTSRALTLTFKKPYALIIIEGILAYKAAKKRKEDAAKREKNEKGGGEKKNKPKKGIAPKGGLRFKL